MKSSFNLELLLLLLLLLLYISLDGNFSSNKTLFSLPSFMITFKVTCSIKLLFVEKCSFIYIAYNFQVLHAEKKNLYLSSIPLLNKEHFDLVLMNFVYPLLSNVSRYSCEPN